MSEPHPRESPPPRQRRCFAWLSAAVLAVAGLVALPGDGDAQTTTSDPLPGQAEASFAAGWLGGFSFGTADANLRTRTGDTYLLFSTRSKMQGAPFLEARASYALSSRYVLEGRFAMSQPELRTAIASDVEGAPELEVAEQIDQYTFGGALAVMLPGLRVGSLLPFASLGAGYLRQLHEGLTLVEEGIAYHVGGGARHALFGRRRGLVEAAGFRGDVRLDILTGGIELSDGPRTHLSASGGFFVTF
jgi:hypothetical protein